MSPETWQAKKRGQSALFRSAWEMELFMAERIKAPRCSECPRRTANEGGVCTRCLDGVPKDVEK